MLAFGYFLDKMEASYRFSLMLRDISGTVAFDASMKPEKEKHQKKQSESWTPVQLVEIRNQVRQGCGPQMARWLTEGLWESPERAAAALTAAFDFVAATIDALTPSEVDPVLYPIRAAQPLRDGLLSKKAAMEMLSISSEPGPDLSVLPAAVWMQKISDALASLDPQRIRKCPLCQDSLFYARRLDQKACSVKHARLLRSIRWLRTGKGKKHYAASLKNPKKSRLLHQPSDVEHGGRRRR